MSLLLALLLQVGPNPQAGGIAGEPDELVTRPPRPGETIEAPLDPVSEWLRNCLEQVASDPARAHAQAQIRRSETSGEKRVIANHCLGVAATELGLWDDARAAFLAARDETPADEARTRARFGAMAGNAALAAGDAVNALTLLAAAESDARAAASASLEALAALDRGRALVALDRPEEALAALRSATGLAPESGEAWLLEATLLRRMDRLGEAQQAIERAVELAPTDGEVGLEAGVIAVLSGREEAARASWQSVVETQPDSLAAETARGYLAQLAPAGENAAREEPPE
ncbi:tetratricopeptide repeat protein [Erythrobacter sp. HL-111]|uniref:tetratricopeptide repeat protein n=1 Tax=Erythrobacter sp. HL-111 TaxID=1798193 RepID=UPI0006DAA53E|nr:tetratricopeptide repeat protein [Erythrobacter sp. HL-111]KPP88350.1 MAG: Tetratricopeptide repeat [Erythrobacteraceae bacterium HL-111]SDS81668.1 Tetratricopeptide repeat-containing protein [Erythrobacter sp. HL-111]